MRRLPALLAAFLLPTASPLQLDIAVVSGILLVAQAPVQGQSAEAVAKVAQAITVRIEGATQGSGVLVKRDGNRYTVLTAWHVVSGQRPGEELDVYTPDGQRHPLMHGSIKRLGGVDLAVLTFASSGSYEVASVGDVQSVAMGNPVWVSGFPLQSSAVPMRLLRFLKGDVIANAMVAIPNGYQLLYSNPTLPGMSGGAVLNAQGQLVGIHGQGETDIKLTEQKGLFVKTGTNQAVPVSFYSAPTLSPDAKAEATFRQSLNVPEPSASLPASSNQVLPSPLSIISPVNRTNGENALTFAAHFLSTGDYENAFVQSSAVLDYKSGSWFASYLRAAAGLALGRRIHQVIQDATNVITINPGYADAYVVRGRASALAGFMHDACSDMLTARSYGKPEASISFSEGCKSSSDSEIVFDGSQSLPAHSPPSSVHVDVSGSVGWKSVPVPVYVRVLFRRHPWINLEVTEREGLKSSNYVTRKEYLNCLHYENGSGFLAQGSMPTTELLHKYFCTYKAK